MNTDVVDIGVLIKLIKTPFTSLHTILHQLKSLLRRIKAQM